MPTLTHPTVAFGDCISLVSQWDVNPGNYQRAKNAASLSGQASGREAQASDEQECVNTVKSWDDVID